MKYTVCTATTLADLIDKVNRYIDAGWKPCGSLLVKRSGTRFYQPVVSKNG